MSDPTGFDDESPEAVVLPGGGTGMAAILAKRLLFTETTASPQYFDILDLPAGSYVHDIVLNIKTPWHNADDTDPGCLLSFAVDFGGPDEAKFVVGGSDLPISTDYNVGNDNALISGNALRSQGIDQGPSLFGYAYFNSDAVPYLPFVALQDTTIQMRYDQASGIGFTSLSQGEVEIWVICQVAA